MKFLRNLFLLGMVLGTLFINASISFSNQASGLKLNPGASLVLDTPIFGWNGTFVNNSNAMFSGEPIFFTDGIVKNNTGELKFTGRYYRGETLALIMEGSNSISASPGQILQTVVVSGQDNVLEGQPLFSDIIFLTDPSAELTLALQSKLNKNILLTGGSLILNDDLHCIDSATIVGPGTIYCNGRGIHWAQVDYIWTDTLTFVDAADINFYSRTNLVSTWSFTGNNIINAHGNVFDLSGVGKLVVSPHTTLYLTDMNLRNVGSGNIILADETSHLYLSNVDIELISNITTTIGNVYVDGSSTFRLKDHDWTFTNDGVLTVDGVTLWLDVNDDIFETPGSLSAYEPIYVDHVWSDSHVATDIAAGNLVILNDGDIKEVASNSTNNVLCELTVAPIANNILLNHNCEHAVVDKVIEVVENVTINGQGAFVAFAHTGAPQFIVAAGKTVRLENITLTNINGTTFQLGDDAQIQIGANVVFELDDDVTFEHERFQIMGTLEDPYLFTVRSVGNRKRLIFTPTYDGESEIIKTFVVGLNALVLENVELVGVESISTGEESTEEGLVVGQVTLSSQAQVNIAQDTDVCFGVEGDDNVLVLLANDLVMNRFIFFSSLFDSALHLQFKLLEKISGNPIVNFSDDLLYVTSTGGRARLIFDDFWATVVNQGSNSFVVDYRSFIGGRNLEILNYPVKQMDINLLLDSTLIIRGDLPNPIDPSFIRTPLFLRSSIGRRARGEVISVLDIIRYKQFQAMHDRAGKKKDEYSKTKAWTQTRVCPAKPRDKGLLSRYPLPDFGVDVQGCEQQLSQASGNVKVSARGTLSHFAIDEGGNPLFLYLGGESHVIIDEEELVRLRSGLNETRTAIKEGDTLIVSGPGNVITIVGNTLTIDSQDLTIDPDAHLTIELQNDAFVLVNTAIVLPSGAQLTFTGNGIVEFGSNASITLEDESELLFADNVHARLSRDADAEQTLSIQGIGTVHLTDQAQFDIKRNKTVIFQGATSDDGISLILDEESRIDVDVVYPDDAFIPPADCPLTRGKACLIFGQGVHTVTLDRDGVINAGRSGLVGFGVDANEDKIQDAGLSSLTISNRAMITVDQRGRLLFSDFGDFAFSAISGSIQGAGLAGLVTDDTSSIGTIQQTLSEIPLRTTTSQWIVNRLINLCSSMQDNIAYVDENGVKKLRLASGKIITLAPDDEIRGEDGSGNVFGVNRGHAFVITANGVRK